MGRVDHAIPVGVEIGHVRVRQHHLHDLVKVNAQAQQDSVTEHHRDIVNILIIRGSIMMFVT